MACDHFFREHIGGCRQILLCAPGSSGRTRRNDWLWVALAIGFTTLLVASPLLANDSDINHFEKKIRPLFIEHCLECHNQDNDSGDLALDSRERLLKGGATGPAVERGQPNASLLIKAVLREGELHMPPEEPLTAVQIADLVTWVKSGAVWPKSTPQLTADEMTARARTHWAFQPVASSPVPKLGESAWGNNPIDAFVRRKQLKQQLQPSVEADRRTLLRRVSYALTGLPPNFSDVKEFVDDPSPTAYEDRVEQLLTSKQYGEHWARHWLDVARYADTKGYVYAREERFWPHAWAYRDWVVRALNQDMAYDRFLLLQLAADQVADRDHNDLAAMGFLTLGRRFLGVNHLIIDDRIDVVTRGTMGLTVGCARCHDHKYDPIPTADYYSLYGVFESSSEKLIRLDEESDNDAEFNQELNKRQTELQEKLQQSRTESSERARSRLRDYLIAQTELGRYPPQGFDQVFQKDDLLPAFVWKWNRYLDRAASRQDPIFIPWHAYEGVPKENFAAAATEITQHLCTGRHGSINALILDQFRTPPDSFREVITRYADVFEAIRDEVTKETFSPPFDDPEKEAIRELLFGLESPSVVPDEPIVHSESYFDSGTLTAIWKLQGEVDRWIIRSQVEAPHALTLQDRLIPHEPQVFIRGNPTNAGRTVPRQFLKVIAGSDRKPFQIGSGRLELARQIIAPENPLTARVIVNRVWTHHFGQGLVSTPSDFGTRSETPSHPELLDWLADWFIDEGWSLKKLHRLIVTSATFKQSSQFPSEESLERARQIDPANRYLSRMNVHRLSFEEFRDSLAATTGEIDLTVGGKPIDLFQRPYSKRRTLYGLVDRQYLPGTLRVFDFANPDLHIAKRTETTVPQQALFFLNHPLVLESVREMAGMVDEDVSDRINVTRLFHRLLQRSPTETEVNDALHFLQQSEQTDVEPPPDTAADWSYGYGEFVAAQATVSDFTPLPHFTGEAWQGGPNWPDAKLGWVQLTATGGHPGNTRQHAAIRRWTAPRTGTYNISSKLIQDAAPGDGVRAFVVSSSQGLLANSHVHQSSAELAAKDVELKQNDIIDFVVDIGNILNSDQYLWSVEIEETSTDQIWNSQRDFVQTNTKTLTPWQQLAHVLVCSNEFQFVD